MNPRLTLGAHWWPQWRSHWRVLHAWPLSAQCLLLSACALLMSLWLSWQVSGQAWLTWWQSQQRQEAALLQLKTLQGQLDQHQQRVAALQAMRHPSGQNWPAWVSISQSASERSSAGIAQLERQFAQPVAGLASLRGTCTASEGECF
jgi:hypothetical protein